MKGNVEGKIELRENILTIGPNGKIRAEVFAKAVVVLGEVVGNVTASEKVDIRDNGSVDGDIISPRVAIAEGAHFRGSVDMQRAGVKPAAATSPPPRGRTAGRRRPEGRRLTRAASMAHEPAQRPAAARWQSEPAGPSCREPPDRSPICFRSSGAVAPPKTITPRQRTPRRNEPAYPTKALAKFLKLLQSREAPALLDLGPVVGSNVTFFGEQLACRIRVEDVATDIDRHVKEDRLADLPKFFETRFPQPAESVDGILCWDVLDFLDRPAATALAKALTRLLRPDGALLGFFSTAEGRGQFYTKYVVVDDTNLRYRTYPAARARQRSLLNRDIIKLFDGLRVTDSF